VSTRRKKKSKKRVMRSFQIDEISGVDSPAQEGASALIMKRAEESDEPERLDEPEETLSDPPVGEEPKSPLESSSGGHETPVEDHEMTEVTESTVTESEAVIKRVELLEKSLEASQAYGELTDVQKAHHNSLDKEGQDAFMALDAQGRTAEIEKAQSDNPIVYTDFEGNDFFKSDDPRTIAAVKRADAAVKVAREAEERAAVVELTKRATDNLAHLPGDMALKIAVLKALDGIEDEDQRSKAHEMLRSNGDKLAEAFVEKGTSDGSVGKSDEQLEALAKKYADEHSTDLVQARVKVLETAEGNALYQQTL